MQSDELPWRWFVEHQTPYTSIVHKVKRIIYSGKTEYQQVDIIETYDLGLCLVLDGKVQSSTKDEWIYHETLVHPTLFTHPEPKRVLIIGGGEGATAREVLKHKCVEKVVMIDIDKQVVELSKKYLREMCGNTFEDPRLELVFADGRKFVEETNTTFDVAIIDVTDPLSGGPSYLLYTKEFYENLYQKLSVDGILATQATSTFYSIDCFSAIYNTISKVFNIVRAAHVWIPSFASTWGFVIGSKRYDPEEIEDLDKRIKRRNITNLKFYTPKIHKNIFVLPPYIERKLKEENRIIYDNHPIFMPA
ncbi:MAG: polyamine aminopropyltransferase [Nitrososphaeria archaeon]